MTMQEIGMESMPNVYISEATLNDIQLRITLTTKDFVESPTWNIQNSILSDKLMFVVKVFAYDNEDTLESIVTQLNNGDISIYDATTSFEKHISFYNHDYLEAEDNLNNFYYELQFNSYEVNKRNIYVYAQAYVDISELNLGFTEYRYLDGPMTSEAIKIDGEFPDNGILFRTPDGGIWSGPVHGHEGDYMVGSFHTEEPHDSLTQETVDSKVRDFLSGLPT